MNSELSTSSIQDQNRHQRAWIIYGALLSMALVGNFWLLVTTGAYGSFAGVAGGSALIFLLLWNHQIEWAGRLFMAFLIGRSLLVGLQSTSVLIPMALIIATVGAVLIQTTFRPQYRRSSYWILAGVIVLLISVDLFWPVDRTNSNPLTGTFLAATGLAALALLVILLIRNFPTYSLRYKFIFSISLFAILSLIATTFFVSRNTSAILLEEAGREFQSAAAFNASVIGETIQRDSELLTILGSEPLIVEHARAAASERVTPAELEALQADWDNPETAQQQGWVEQEIDRLQSYPASDILERYESVILRGSHNVILVDSQGKVIASTSKPDQYYFGEEEWFKHVQQQGHPPFISNAYSTEEDGHVEMLFAVPIIDDSSGQFLGAVAAPNDLITVKGLFETTNSLGTNAIMGVIVADNKELTVEDGELTFKEIFLSDELFDRLKTNGFGLGDFFGTPNLISYVEIESPRDPQSMATLDWAVIIHQEESIALAAVTTQQRTQLLIGILVVTVGVVAAIVVAQVVAAPLLALQDAARRMAQGDYSVRAPIQSGDEIASVAHAFNNMASEIQDSVQNLESRIAERTQTLNTSFRISRSLATLIRKGDLIETVVEELTLNLGYHQVQIYMLDPTTQTLELADASGEIGRELLDQKFSVDMGQGIIGRAAESQAAILVSDVAADPRFVPNPLLPQTRSELAVPIVVGQRTLGVIDIQDDKIGRLNDRDIELVESIAGQLAISLRNADFYEEAESQARREATINHIRQRILQTQNVGDALKIAARELAQVTDGKVVVRLGQENNPPSNGEGRSE